MIYYFLRTLRSQLRQSPSLFLLSVLGVALGVASVMAIQLINRGAIGAFSASLRSVGGEADLTIVPRGASFSEEVFPLVLSVEGVTAAWPLYQIDVALGGKTPLFLEVMGVDFFAPTSLPWSTGSADVSAALLEPGWIAVSPQLAEEMGWRRGQKLEVSSGTRRVELVVGALIDLQRISPLANRKLCLMDISQVQSLLGRPGQLHQIFVLTKGATAQVGSRLEARLGSQVVVMTPEQRENQAAGLMSAFRLNLTALSLISLLVGMFVVYTSSQASLLRRRLEFGLLRTLGATRGQVLGLIFSEVVCLGAAGVLVGLPLGYWVARANLEMVSSTLTNLYLLEEIESLQMPWWMILLAFSIGILGAISGSLIPALDMSRRDSRALFTGLTLRKHFTSLAVPLFLTGWALLLAVGLWYFLWGYSWQPAGFVLALAVLAAVPFLTPLTVQLVCGRVRPRGFGFSYSLRSLSLRPQTACFAVASLAIAVSMLVGITLMISSFRSTVQSWVQATVQGDIYISTISWRSRPGASLDDELVANLSSHPGVRAVDQLRRTRVWTANRRLAVTGVDMTLAEGGSRFPLLEGDRARILEELRLGGAILISEPLSRKMGLARGDRLVLNAGQGELGFPIAGVFFDYSSELGVAFMDLSTYQKSFGAGPIDSLSLYLEEDLEPDRVVDEIKARFPSVPLRIRSNRQLREEIFNIFDQTFAVVRILQVMSLLIAVCGITLALLIMARERSSEVALYRALGAQRWQVFRIFVGKGLAIGLIAMGLGTVAGVLQAAILIRVINRTYFGWTIQAHWPGWSLVEQFAAILTVAVLASFYPALRASQTPATELTREDS